jgi:hypothetical protein
MFINFPSEKKDRLSYHLQKEGNLYYGKVLYDEWNNKTWEDKKERLLKGETVISDMWWQHFTVCTDGKFFFISIPEIEGKPINPQAKPGLRDRF